MRKLTSLAIFVVLLQALVVCHAADKCWFSSPPTELENRLVFIASSSGMPRCFDPATLEISKSNDKTEVMVRVYAKSSAKSRIDLAKKGIVCVYDYQDIIYSCANNGNCVTQILSWIWLNEKYEPTYKMDAQFFASIKMPYPITWEMNSDDYAIFSKLIDYKKPVKEPSPPLPQAPPPMSADDGTDDT